MSDVIMIDNSIDQGSILVPVSTVQADFVTETGTIVYVPLASTHSPGIVTIGEGLLISPDGLLEFDRTEVTLKSLALNGKLLEPDENKHINIVLTKNDVGLDKVDNTADEDKPVSLATRAALNELDEKLTLNINNVNDDLVAHVNRADNPHKVTKEQIGLGNVDNTSDINKPISRATKNELARIERLIKGAANIFSYDSYEALVEDVNPLDDSVFKVGQSVYIRTLNVPDLWVFSVEEEPVEFEYTTDADIENLLKTDGSFQVGYFKFAALETGKVNLDSYVTLDTAQTIPGDKNYTGLLKLNDKPVAVKEDLDNYVTKDGYTMRASSTVGEFYYNTGTGEKAIQLKMPTIPVTSVNGLTGDVVIDLSKYVTSDALSAVTDATLSDDNKTLTITKRDGTSFDFQGGGGSDVDLSGYIPQGGTLTAPLKVTGGDQATSGKIILDQANKGQITNTETATLFGFNDSATLNIGHANYNMSLRGKGARPKYQNKDMALMADLDGYVTTDTTEQTISGTKKFTANNNTFTRTLVLGANTPINFTGIGSGTYNIGAFVCNTTDKFGVECPRESDSSSAAIIPFRIGARGGQLGILQAGNIYQNGKQVANKDDLNTRLAIDGSNTMTGKLNLKASGANDSNIGDNGIRWNLESLPQSTEPEYVCVIDGFAIGGRQKWSTVLDVYEAMRKVVTPNWHVSQDGSGNLVFNYT